VGQKTWIRSLRPRYPGKEHLCLSLRPSLANPRRVSVMRLWALAAPVILLHNVDTILDFVFVDEHNRHRRLKGESFFDTIA